MQPSPPQSKLPNRQLPDTLQLMVQLWAWEQSTSLHDALASQLTTHLSPGGHDTGASSVTSMVQTPSAQDPPTAAQATSQSDAKSA